ncbi:MAG: rRNA maturation RNase YbeY, partial [Mycoplasma sp.]|nr:rRNA maturation RNase YbeY [Mycoplasma sp.]
REYCYLFTHSLLHLIGYDHQTEEDAKKMNEIVNKIMEKLNIER